MENNNNTYQQTQPGYTYPDQYQVDPNYAAKAKQFLTRTIVMDVVCSLPVGSIIAIIKAEQNRNDIIDYISHGGPHTTRLQVCSALSRAAKYAGIGYTIFWAGYMLYFAVLIIGLIAAALA